MGIICTGFLAGGTKKENSLWGIGIHGWLRFSLLSAFLSLYSWNVDVNQKRIFTLRSLRPNPKKWQTTSFRRWVSVTALPKLLNVDGNFWMRIPCFSIAVITYLHNENITKDIILLTTCLTIVIFTCRGFEYASMCFINGIQHTLDL